jgi:hypothetical protein
MSQTTGLLPRLQKPVRQLRDAPVWEIAESTSFPGALGKTEAENPKPYSFVMG